MQKNPSNLIAEELTFNCLLPFVKKDTHGPVIACAILKVARLALNKKFRDLRETIVMFPLNSFTCVAVTKIPE